MGKDEIGCRRNGVTENGGCKSFEKEIYWNNFKSTRFFIPLSSDFLSQLMIPKKFSKKMRNELPQMVVLKSPGGGAWEVQLVWDKNNLFFRDGWKEYAKAHSLKENDLLMFEYTRDSSFKVLMFNEQDLCEKASSYFVRDSGLGKTDAGESSQSKRKKSRGNSDEYSDAEETSAQAFRRKNHRHSVCGLNTSGAYKKTSSTTHTQNREPASKVGSERALEMATRKKTDESFIVVMRTNNVSNYFRLGISAPWARNYLAQKHQDLELRTNGKKWFVRFNVEQRCGGGVLVSGWYNFVVDNSLKESDVCLFKLVSQKDEPAIFDVLIFRADQPSSYKPSSV